MIGQSQVTEPLMTALRTNRVNHAYLFSGPRGCGKTTSARILARCLNCAEGPTDTPCGVCSSCVELSRDGGGSLDVVEIDAASHNGVDDARDLRERAIYAPARDRYKIFILDEAHMVTPQGFNALLKLVEEPPEHVKFIFATTEPEKVIGTIRSRTHHYPFRLIAPATMLDYVQTLCDEEKVTVEAGVLPLVVRAGGGSARDTLSLLDQIIAGSEGNTVNYERAVALLGYTHTALLDDVVDALGAHDAPEAFAAVDRVVQTGQDPRRFVEDLLERLRDLIIVDATGASASTVLRGVAADEIAAMYGQAKAFGAAALSQAADITNQSLTEMIGATSPKLHLELMIARLLVAGGASAGQVQPKARIETTPAPAPVAEVPKVVEPVETKLPEPVETKLAEPAEPTAAAVAVEPAEAPAAVIPTGPVGTKQLLEVWPAVLEAVQKQNRMSWIVCVTAQVRELDDEVLTLVFPSEKDAAAFRPQKGVPGGVHEILRDAINGQLGITVKFRISVEGTPTASIPTSSVAAQPVVLPSSTTSETSSSVVEPTESRSKREFATPAPVASTASPTSVATDDGWNVAVIPGSASEAVNEPIALDQPELQEVSAEDTAHAPAFGEAVVRQILGATLIGEETVNESEIFEVEEDQPLAMLDNRPAAVLAAAPADDIPFDDEPPVDESDR
jgi:DNA polymerase-3 subunit gamma/tau